MRTFISVLDEIYCDFEVFGDFYGDFSVSYRQDPAPPTLNGRFVPGHALNSSLCTLTTTLRRIDSTN